MFYTLRTDNTLAQRPCRKDPCNKPAQLAYDDSRRYSCTPPAAVSSVHALGPVPVAQGERKKRHRRNNRIGRTTNGQTLTPGCLAGGLVHRPRLPSPLQLNQTEALDDGDDEGDDDDYEHGSSWSGLGCPGVYIRTYGLVWSCITFSGLVWSGLASSGRVWPGMVRCDPVWSGVVRSGLVWSGLRRVVVWSILVRFCLV